MVLRRFGRLQERAEEMVSRAERMFGPFHQEILTPGEVSGGASEGGASAGGGSEGQDGGVVGDAVAEAVQQARQGRDGRRRGGRG